MNWYNMLNMGSWMANGNSVLAIFSHPHLPWKSGGGVRHLKPVWISLNPMYNIFWACFIASLYDCFQTKKTIIHPHLSSLQNFQPFFKETTNPVILIPCQPPTPAAFRAARCRSWSGWLSGPRRRCGTPRWRSPWSLGNGDVAGDTWGNHRNLWYL